MFGKISNIDIDEVNHLVTYAVKTEKQGLRFYVKSLNHKLDLKKGDRVEYTEYTNFYSIAIDSLKKVEV